MAQTIITYIREVSTLSRLKAAGKRVVLLPSGGCSFNTQPPEGGWAT
nr:hypothetical protein [Neisseria mucosa]